MKEEKILNTQGTKGNYTNRGYSINWKCPNCKYRYNDRIIVVTDHRDTYNCKCDKCQEIITIANLTPPI